jgi:ribonuclease HI
LAEHTVDFTSRSVIKSQVIADFITDWTPETPSQEQSKIEAFWQLVCDGAYCKDGAGASAILTAPLGTPLKYAVRLNFDGCTNNVVEYEGLLLGLRKARSLGARRLFLRSDSELIGGHINKSNRALKPNLVKYLVAVRGMEKYFLRFTVCYFPRTQNKIADELAKAVAQGNPLPPDVFFETLTHGSINCAEEPTKFVTAITSEDWREAVMAYLRGHFVPEDEKEEMRMALRARNYSIVNEDLYRGGVLLS